MGNEGFAAIVVGTGFASTFFLREYLRLAPQGARVLVLEKGRKLPYHRKLAQQLSSDIDLAEEVINLTPEKPWIQNIAFGGGSCWIGNTPRPHPSDFELKTRYGVGEDWPLSYFDLEPYLVEVEEAMGISGSSAGPFPRSKPYPAPPHAFNSFDLAIAAKYPDQHIPMPSARSTSNRTGRPTCCGNGVCSLCPITAKFQIDLHMAWVYDDPRVTLRLESPAESMDAHAGRVRGVHYNERGRDRYAACDIVALGAHAIFTPHIMLRSGINDPALGRYLHETFSVNVQLDLRNLDSLDGTQSVTGLGVMFHDTDRRSQRATCNIESWNVPWLRAERGRWRQRALLKFIFDDLPSHDNYVGLARDDETRPVLYYPALSPYTRAGFDAVPELVEDLIEGLPVEDYEVMKERSLGSDAHIQGTTRMGADPATSVVDRNLVHHSLRNLVVLGSGVFPSCPVANPTLILSALSILAARKLVS